MGKGILAGASGGGGVDIPITSEIPANADIWIDPNEEDQSSNFYTKDETLNDITKSELGLGDSATPNDAFLKLFTSSSGYGSELGNEYLWRRQKLVREFVPGTTTTNTARAFTALAYKEIRYAEDPITVVEGVPSVLNVSSITTLQQLLTAIQSTLPGKYVKTNYTAALMYFPENVVFSISGDSIVANPGIDYPNFKVETVVLDDVYLNSSDPEAYPPSESDGYTYTFLGRLGDMKGIDSGSYVGTGKCGTSNKNTLTFRFEPKMVLIFRDSQSILNSNGGLQNMLLWLPGTPNQYNGSSSSDVMVSFAQSGISLSYYITSTNSGNADYQMNYSGKTYRYIALG